MNIPFVDLSLQQADIKQEIGDAIRRVTEQTNYILGDEIPALEAEFAAYCGSDFAVGVDSGFSALELILRGYGIGEGDEVITVTHTFIATALSISTCGATPVLVDVAPNQVTIDSSQIEKAITPKTKAVIMVHLYGETANVDAIKAITDKHNLILIEDACQAHGAYYKSASGEKKRAGNLGHAAAFSFYPSKNLGALGDGGMITTSDSKLVNQLHLLRNIGQSEKNVHSIKGFNRRLDTLHAAVLRAKLPQLDSWNAKRREAALWYKEKLERMDIGLPRIDDDFVYHLFVVRVSERDALQRFLNDAGIATGVHYPTPIHMQIAFEDLAYKQGDLPHAELLASEILSLPIYPGITKEQVSYVCDKIEQFFVESARSQAAA